MTRDSIRDLWYAKRTLAARCQVAACGCETITDPAYDWDGMRRETTPYVIVKRTTAGRGAYRYEGREFAVEPGSLMLVPLPHENRYWLPPEGSWSFVWACLHGLDAQQAVAVAIDRHGPVIDLPERSLVAAALDDLVASVLDQSPPSAYAASALAYRVVMGVLELADQGDATLPSAIRAATTFAERHLAAGIGVADLARASGLSRHHFSRRFSAALGRSPAAWLTARRVERAAALLRAGGAVTMVAAECGYRDPSYFCKVFRKHYGLSPGAFRDSGAMRGS